LITRASPVSQQPSPPPPPILAPKPFGKTITEYRTLRRIGNGGETITTTMCNDAVPSTDMNNKRLTSINSDKRSSRNSFPSNEELMESIRRFGGSQNLGKK
jgi:hypothetical protein